MTPDPDSPEQAPNYQSGAAGKQAKTVSAEVRGEAMAFALQSAACNLGANFFEPYIGYRIQKQFAAKGTDAAPSHGTYTQNLAGELAGDVIGASTIIFAEAVCPEQLHAFTRRARKFVDPLYDSVAHMVFAKDRGSPDYEKKVEEWKLFQERNLVRSAIIAGAGIAGNLATQKYLVRNPSLTGLIFAGKLTSTAITTALGLTVRLAFPEKMKKVDSWISKKMFGPILKKKDDQPVNGAEPQAESQAHFERLLQQSTEINEASR
jgi:hypothetical protein